MENTISREEHEEFAKRMEEENNRQNHRLGKLEETVEQIHSLTSSVETSSVEKLAASIQQMVQEQKRQGERLEALENRDGEMWRKAIINIVAAIAGAVLGYIFHS